MVARGTVEGLGGKGAGMTYKLVVTKQSQGCKMYFTFTSLGNIFNIFNRELTSLGNIFNKIVIS